MMPGFCWYWLFGCLILAGFLLCWLCAVFLMCGFGYFACWVFSCFYLVLLVVWVIVICFIVCVCTHWVVGWFCLVVGCFDFVVLFGWFVGVLLTFCCTCFELLVGRCWFCLYYFCSLVVYFCLLKFVFEFALCWVSGCLLNLVECVVLVCLHCLFACCGLWFAVALVWI